MLSGPFTYHITFNPERITGVEGPSGKKNLSGPASQLVPKLYVISHEHRPLYVGVTKQRISARLRQGFQSKYRYKWTQYLKQAAVDIWLLKEGVQDMTPIETIEAEAVLLIRQKYGQWPEHQTEIHFHRSEPAHRTAARDVIKHYGKTYVFEVDIEREEDGRWGAVINALPGCYAIGFTKEQTLEALQDNAQAFLEVIAEHGDPMPWERQNFDMEFVTVTL